MSADLVFTPEERENFKNAFDAFDENRDDRVATSLLSKLLRAVGFNPLPGEIEDMVEDIGATNFDFECFMYIVYHHARAVDPEQDLVKSFRVFDKKGEGKLSTKLVRQILKHLKQPFTDDEIDELFVQADITRADQYIEYEEFVKVVLEF
jgi:Ca2+-binding EF-hand superfamily protein